MSTLCIHAYASRSRPSSQSVFCLTRRLHSVELLTARPPDCGTANLGQPDFCRNLPTTLSSDVYMPVGHILEDDDVFRRSKARLPQERVLLTLERALLHRILLEGSDAPEPRGSQQHVCVFRLAHKQSVGARNFVTFVKPCCKSKDDGSISIQHVRQTLAVSLQFVRCSSISVVNMSWGHDPASESHSSSGHR